MAPQSQHSAYNGLPVLNELKEYPHTTTNMLVDARMPLFVIYPELVIQGTKWFRARIRALTWLEA